MILTCANCSALLTIKSRFAHYVTCTHCQTVNAFEKDTTAVVPGIEIAHNFSVLQIGTTGSVAGRSFELIGRIVVDCDSGAWNEWCAIDQLGNMLWLSESFGHYYFLDEEIVDASFDAYKNLPIGHQLSHKDLSYCLQSKDNVSCIGVEGELPIRTHLTSSWLSLDFRSHTREVLFVNADKTDVCYYVGTSYDFDELNFSNLRSL